MGVAGASRFLGAATLANTRGISAQSPTLLSGGSTSPTGLLDVGRGISNGGFGLSASARALNNAFFNRTSEVNGLFSLAAGPDATVEAAQQQILALRAGLPESQLSRSVRGDEGIVAENAAASASVDDGSIAASEQGQLVDEEA